MSQENVEVVRRWYDLFQRGDWESAVGDADPEIEIIEPQGVVGSRRYHGHEGLVEALRGWPSQWDDFQVELVQIIDAGPDQVVSLTRHHARGKGSGVEVERELAYLMTFRDAMAIRWEMFLTLAEALEAAGLRE
jgi:ketosteroid isomerase-like protein